MHVEWSLSPGLCEPFHSGVHHLQYCCAPRPIPADASSNGRFRHNHCHRHYVFSSCHSQCLWTNTSNVSLSQSSIADNTTTTTSDALTPPQPQPLPPTVLFLPCNRSYLPQQNGQEKLGDRVMGCWGTGGGLSYSLPSPAPTLPLLLIQPQLLFQSVVQHSRQPPPSPAHLPNSPSPSPTRSQKLHLLSLPS
jgi:hypothetical protein